MYEWPGRKGQSHSHSLGTLFSYILFLGQGFKVQAWGQNYRKDIGPKCLDLDYLSFMVPGKYISFLIHQNREMNLFSLGTMNRKRIPSKG